jgi:hypothetical protein
MNDGRKASGYDADATAAVERLVRGAKLANALRFAGNSMGGPGLTSAGAAIAALTTGNPLPFVVPAAGFALKGAANLVQKAAANRLVRQLSAASPLGQGVAAANAATRAANSFAARYAMANAAARAGVMSKLQGN